MGGPEARPTAHLSEGEGEGRSVRGPSLERPFGLILGVGPPLPLRPICAHLSETPPLTLHPPVGRQVPVAGGKTTHAPHAGTMAAPMCDTIGCTAATPSYGHHRTGAPARWRSRTTTSRTSCPIPAAGARERPLHRWPLPHGRRQYLSLGQRQARLHVLPHLRHAAGRRGRRAGLPRPHVALPRRGVGRARAQEGRPPHGRRLLLRERRGDARLLYADGTHLNVMAYMYVG